MLVFCSFVRQAFQFEKKQEVKHQKLKGKMNSYCHYWMRCEKTLGDWLHFGMKMMIYDKAKLQGGSQNRSCWMDMGMDYGVDEANSIIGLE